MRFTKLDDTRAAIEGVLTELDAAGNPTNAPYVGTIADSSAAPYSVPASRFTSAYQYPSFKNYRNLAGNADNASFAIEPGKADYVVVISVDGMGTAYVKPLLQAGLANELVNIKRIMNEAAGTLNARDDYNYAVTLPNHVTMMTSRGVSGAAGHGWTSNTDPGTATLESNKGSYVDSGFGVAHDAGLRTGIWSGKSKFSLFQQSYSATTGAADTNGVDNGRDKIDYDLISNGISAANITANFTNQMTAAPCHFAFLHYQDPDATGHASGWSTDPASAFATTLKAVDNAIGSILQMIENSPTLTGRTAVILTADHGGHGTTHGDTTNPLDYTIPFYVWGPGVTAGADLYTINPTTREAPGASVNPPYTGPQPVRDGDAANLALSLLGLPPIPASMINAEQDLAVSGDVQPQPREHISNQADLLGVGFRQLALADAQRVFQAHTDMATHQGGLCDQWHLVTTCPQNRPLVGLSEQLVSDALHVNEVFGVGANPAQHTQHELQKDRALDQASVHKVLEVVEVPNVVALEFEAGAMRTTQPFEDILDVAKGVAEDGSACAFDVIAFPFMLEGIELVEHRKNGEVDGPHIA